MADMHKKEVDKLSGVETTGHEWDGLKELNNPLPKWWLYIFYATIVWAIGYWIVYPKGRHLTPDVRNFIKWLKAEATNSEVVGV